MKGATEAGRLKRKRETLRLEEWERNRFYWETVPLFCLAVHWGALFSVLEGGQSGTRGAELCLLLLSFVRKGKLREVWSVLEHLHAGLPLVAYVFRRTVWLFFLVMLISKQIHCPDIMSETQPSRGCIWPLCSHPRCFSPPLTTFWFNLKD